MSAPRDLEPTFLAVFRELRPRTPPPPIEIGFYPFTGLNSTLRLRQGRLLVRISDLLAAAPEPVLEALAHILLGKLYRRAIAPMYARRYRDYVNRREIAAKAELIRALRGRKRMGAARGRHYDLEEMFDALNARFFLGWMARPNLGWAGAEARRNLAHFDAAHNAILVSRVFDNPAVPRFVLEYVLFHEMLHLRHPVRRLRGRRCVHSPEFRLEERAFPQWAEAEAWLKKL